MLQLKRGARKYFLAFAGLQVLNVGGVIFTARELMHTAHRGVALILCGVMAVWTINIIRLARPLRETWTVWRSP